MKKTLILTFHDGEERAFRYRLEDPKEDLTGPTVKAAMDEIIAQNIFVRNLSTAEKAEIQTTTVEELPLI